MATWHLGACCRCGKQMSSGTKPPLPFSFHSLLPDTLHTLSPPGQGPVSERPLFFLSFCPSCMFFRRTDICSATSYLPACKALLPHRDLSLLVFSLVQIPEGFPLPVCHGQSLLVSPARGTCQVQGLPAAVQLCTCSSHLYCKCPEGGVHWSD